MAATTNAINFYGLLGELEDSWYTIDIQNRGSLHTHCILWLKNKQFEKNLITATMSTNNLIQEKIKKYQTHKHRPRCYLKGNICLKVVTILEIILCII